MSTFFRFKSLRTRLVFWFLLVTMLCLLAAVSILYSQRAGIIRGGEIEKIEIIRDLKIRELNGWLEGRMGDLLVGAEDDEVRNLETVLSKTKDRWTAEDLKAVSVVRVLMQRAIEVYTAYNEVFFIEATSGSVAISTDPTREGDDKRKYPYFIEPMQTGKPFVQDVYYSKTDGKPTMIFSAPVFSLSPGGEHLIGVFVMRTDLEQSLYPLLQDRTGAGETGETLIVNKDGFAVNALQWHENAPLKFKIKAEPAVRAIAGETGVVEAKDYRGEMVLAAYTHISLMGWGFVVKRDIAEIYAPIRAMLRQMVGLVVVSLLVIFFVSFFLSGTIALPVVGIGAIVEQFTKGDLQVRCPEGGSDEIAALGVSFNEMAAILSSQMTIQIKCAEISESLARSAELEEAAQALAEKAAEVAESYLSVFYLRGENGNIFDPVTSVGANRELLQPFDGGILEGNFGKVLSSKKITCTRDIPDDTRFTFRAVVGVALPKEILMVPLVVEEKVCAVLALASLRPYSHETMEALEQAWPNLNTAVANLLANRETHMLAEEVTIRNRKLEATAGELRALATELEAQGLQLRDANRLKSEFLSNMSHELRTPLNSIITLSELMQSRGPGKNVEKDTEYLRVIQSNGFHLLRLINDILDLSKIEAGRMDVYLEEVGATSLLERVFENTRHLAEDKGLEMRIHTGEPLILLTDEGKVYQILLNLISNALKFTEQGTIDVALSREGQSVVFSVKDTGIGIAESNLGHIFEEFRQVDGSTTRRHEGTGLGLAICRRLARLLGGDISVESVPGEGSTFLLVLPVECPKPIQMPVSFSPPVLPVPEQSTPSAPTRMKRTVLVVDDEPDVCNLIRHFLVEIGYDVVMAYSGAEALRIAKAIHPFVITLDVLMPDMDGWEVLRSLKESEATADIPVIVISVSENHATAMALGTTGYCVKPVTREMLLLALERLSPSGAIRNVLVVDDDPVVREFLSVLLEEKGYRAVAVSGGKEALATILTYPPDVVVLDLMMPNMDGFRVLEQLRRQSSTRNLPVIVVSAKDLTPAEREELGKTTRCVIPKGGMDREHLFQELADALASLGEKPAEVSTTTRPCILVVEDNEIAVLQIRSTLEEKGYEVVVASGGGEALAILSRLVPDAVVLDLMMPDIDGFAVLELIRSTPWTKKLPVLVLTAKELTREDRACLTYNNVQELVQKGSLNREELVLRIERLLKRYPAAVEPFPSPVIQEEQNIVTVSTVPSRPVSSEGQQTVLIVEDNADNMFTITEILDEMGLANIRAEDGQEGVRKAQEFKPDLILMDIQLPGMSGLEATSLIRASPEISGTPIIAMSAKAMAGDREVILDAGCNAYLPKPFDTELVRNTIEKHLGRLAQPPPDNADKTD